VKIIAGCEGTVINSTVGLLCRRPGFTSEIYGHITPALTAFKEYSFSEYSLEACPLRKSDNNSLDFVVNRFFNEIVSDK